MSLPIRARLTVWYAIAFAAILVALAVFLGLRLRSDLRSTIAREVRQSAADIADSYTSEGAGELQEASESALPRAGSAAQVLDARGRVVHSYGGALATEPMASASLRATALAGRSRLVEMSLGDPSQAYYVLASPVTHHDQRQVLVVAESLGSADEAVKRVVVLLLLAGPAALVATVLIGWWLAGAAFRPVVRMTAKASEIGLDRLHERLVVPTPRDEIRSLAENLNAMLDRLERGVTANRRLIADASHDLRTPLAVMRAELDVRLRRDGLVPSERTTLESVREEVDAMSRTVTNLLTLSQADEGRLELDSTRLDLLELVNAAARPLRAVAAARDVELRIAGEHGPTDGDEARLQQALANLIENAIRFTPKGGEVRVNCWRRASEVGVTVADDGPGIPAEARGHVFDRFYRVDPARGREAGGSGLGLAICREIAAAHGGRVWVEDGTGSALSLALPLGSGA